MTAITAITMLAILGQKGPAQVHVPSRGDQHLQRANLPKPLSVAEKKALVMSLTKAQFVKFGLVRVMTPLTMAIGDDAYVQLRYPSSYSADPYGAFFWGGFVPGNIGNSSVKVLWKAEKGKSVLLSFAIHAQGDPKISWELTAEPNWPGGSNSRVTRSANTDKEFSSVSILVTPKENGTFQTELFPTSKFCFSWMSVTLTEVEMK